MTRKEPPRNLVEPIPLSTLVISPLTADPAADPEVDMCSITTLMNNVLRDQRGATLAQGLVASPPSTNPTTDPITSSEPGPAQHHYNSRGNPNSPSVTQTPLQGYVHNKEADKYDTNKGN